MVVADVVSVPSIDTKEDVDQSKENAQGDQGILVIQDLNDMEYLANLGQQLQQQSDVSVSCDDIYEYWNTNWRRSYSIQYRYDDIFLQRLCPEQFNCNGDATNKIDTNYLGTTTKRQRQALVWLSRIAAFLSLGGASYILYRILWVQRQQRLRGITPNNSRAGTARKTTISVYQQLLVGMAIFDIITAIAWCFASLPIDVTTTNQYDYIYDAMGNNYTCKTQAFAIQLGFTSIFYNVSLAVYYVLVVVYNWREFQFQQRGILKLMHAIPLMIGLTLAFAGIPWYGVMTYGCHFLPFNPYYDQGNFWIIMSFVVIPLALSIIVITISMIMVYVAVRKQVIAASKWSFMRWGLQQQQGTSSTIESSLSPVSAVAAASSSSPTATVSSTATVATSTSSTRDNLALSSLSSLSSTPSTTTPSSLQQNVFWQCFLHAIAFHISWPILFGIN